MTPTPTDGLTDEFLGKLHMAYSIGWSKPVNAHPSTYPYHERLNAYEAMRALLSPLLVAAEARGRREALGQMRDWCIERQAMWVEDSGFDASTLEVTMALNECDRLLATAQPSPAPAPPPCGAKWACDTSVACQLPVGHTENHRGEQSHLIAQWPDAEVESPPAPSESRLRGCETCDYMWHAAWHHYARRPLNPLALLEFIAQTPDAERIAKYVRAVTGIVADRWPDELPRQKHNQDAPSEPTAEPVSHAAALRPASPVPAPVERPDPTMTVVVDGKPVTFNRTLPDPPCALCGHDPSTSWPAVEFPDARCLDCGRPYELFPIDLIMPRPQWLEIHPDENGVICAQCMMVRAAKVPGATCVHAIIEIAPPRSTTKP